MQITVLKSKLHTGRVTDAELDYEGSIVIDGVLLDAVGIREYEKVLAANFTNGNRYETYAIRGVAGSGVISVNGAGARYSCVGDSLTIFAFATIDEADSLVPRIALLNADNTIKSMR